VLSLQLSEAIFKRVREEEGAAGRARFLCSNLILYS